MTVIDSVVRLLPGVLGQEDSHIHDSFSTGLLEHPHYTRPADFRGMKVPMFYCQAIMRKLTSGVRNNR